MGGLGNSVNQTLRTYVKDFKGRDFKTQRVNKRWKISLGENLTYLENEHKLLNV